MAQKVMLNLPSSVSRGETDLRNALKVCSIDGTGRRASAGWKAVVSCDVFVRALTALLVDAITWRLSNAEA